MRQIDTDDAQPLGPAKPRETPKSAPAETEVRPGIIRDSEGKLRTNIPENERAKYAHNPAYEWFKNYGVWG